MAAVEDTAGTAAVDTAGTAVEGTAAPAEEDTAGTAVEDTAAPAEVDTAAGTAAPAVAGIAADTAVDTERSHHCKQQALTRTMLHLKSSSFFKSDIHTNHKCVRLK